MRVRTTIVAALLFGSFLAGTRAARAGDQEYPISYVERPLTLPKLTLAPELEFDVTHVSLQAGPFTESETGVGLALGAGFGITDDLEVDVTLLPLEFAPAPVRYVGPTLGATYRFLKGDVEVGGQFTAHFDVGHDTSPAVQVYTPGVPVLIHAGKVARIDTGVFVPIEHVNSIQYFGFETAGATLVGLSVPVRVAFDIVEPLHVGVNTGFGMTLNPGGSASAGDTVVVPLGFFAGYAIGEKRPIVDIDPFFQWVDFLTPGGTDKVNAGIFVTGISARGYLYL